ncbi:hypothetical protein Rsub_07675 [Raphidocelis subcapitata]|uniref:Ribosome biogenesis protein SLX9 n=1 Tax=Raphidocelis subcapitata TaxID=307507 RepID=A0A2V0P5D5_9CHLO|nr:hypothetical protein Rsub_07675 [Raphidocelis subcapitata]|eukprot:GBF95091.1 hypothetical protein Rsub_07675 [Raphidocelis subcapitata]
MVKRKVGGAQRYRRAAAGGEGEGGGAEAAQPGPLPPQHVQRKVNRKVKFLERVAASKKAALAATGGGVAKKRKAKSKPLPTLDSLAGALSAVEAAVSDSKASKAKQSDKGRGSSVKRLKARRAIALTETQRLQAVMEHPSFKADPLAAISHHLQATLPPPPPTAAAPKPQGSKQARKAGKQRQRLRQERQQQHMQTDG